MHMKPGPARGVLSIFEGDDTESKLDIDLKSASIEIGSSCEDTVGAGQVVVGDGRIGVVDERMEPRHVVLQRREDGSFWLESVGESGCKLGEEPLEKGDTRRLDFAADFYIGSHRFRLAPPPSEPDTPPPPTPEASTQPADPAAEPKTETESTTDDQPAAAAPRPAAPAKPLPNGMVGTLYRQPIPDLKISEIGQPRIAIPEGLGLEASVDKDALVITGTPTAKGDYTISVEYDLPERPERVLNFSVFVNPDPRSLWKDLESDPTLPYQKSKTDNHRLDAGEALLVAASVRGRSHAHEGTFRDDHFLLDSRDGWHFVAVSDGAGSAKYSREGSKIACETVREQVYDRISQLDDLLKDQPTDGIEASTKGGIKGALYEVFGTAGKTAFEDIRAEAEASADPDAKTGDYAATLIYTVYKRFNFGWFIAAFAIGDGGIAVYDENAEIKVLNTPDGGEYAGQTRFATMPAIWESEPEITSRIRVCITDSFQAIIAMTDGVSDPKFGTDKNFFDTAEWNAFWQDVTSRVDFSSDTCDQDLLEWLDFWSTGNHDDRTIAIGLMQHG